jgi:uncharacterized membrane protein
VARLSKKLKQLGFTSFWETLLLCSFILFSVLLYSLTNFIQHARFETFMYDLGVVDQVLFKASKFYAPVSTVFNFPSLLWNRHLDLTFFLLVPFYFIWSDVRMYLILEPAIIALGSFPIYLLAKEKLGRLLAFVVTFSYLFSLGVQFALDFPGHGDVRIATLLAYLFYFIFKKNHKLVYLCALLSLLTKENSVLYLLFIGFYTALFLKEKKLGMEIITLSGFFWLWFSEIFLPSQRIVYPFWEWYRHLRKNFGDIFLLVFPWSKIKTVIWLLSSFGFWPLLSPAFLLVSFPMFAERFLANRAELWGLALHYNVLSAPVFVFSTILGLGGLKKQLRIRKKVFAILLSCHLVVFTLMTTIWQKTFLTRLFDPSFYHLPEYLGATNEMLSVIPHYASVEAQEDLFPHLSHRDKIYPLGEGGAVEFVVLDVNLYAASKGGKGNYIKKLLADPDYGLVFCEEGAVLFERGKKDKVEICPRVREFIEASGKLN